MAGENDPDLKTLTDQFVRVRVVQMGGVDLSLFQFDPMLSWAIFFMNADKTIYGRYGRAHPASKRAKKDSNPNPNKTSLRSALTAALGLHKDYELDRAAGKKRFAGKTGKPVRWRYAEKTPAARKYKRLKRVNDGGDGCVHCHEVLRTAIDSYFMSKIRVPDDHLWLYPRPPSIGLTLDELEHHRVRRVESGSPAAKAGLKVGDRLLTMDGQILISMADVQWILHNVPTEGGVIPLTVFRGTEEKALTLTLPQDWRYAEDFAWRYRMAGYAAWLWGGFNIHDHAQGVRIGKPSPWWFKKPNQDARKTLKTGDIIIEVDGTKGMDRSRYLAHLMRDVRLGRSVKLKVIRAGETIDLSFKIPKKQPEVQGH